MGGGNELRQANSACRGADCGRRRLRRHPAEIKNQKSQIKNSTGLFQLDGLLDEVEAARAAHLCEVAAVEGEEAALRGPVFVDAAGGRAVAVLLEERALEKYLAARAAAVAVAAPERERRDDLVALEAYADEAPELAVRLLGSKLRVLESLFNGPMRSQRVKELLIIESLARELPFLRRREPATIQLRAEVSTSGDTGRVGGLRWGRVDRLRGRSHLAIAHNRSRRVGQMQAASAGG